MNKKLETINKSSTGMNENTAALIAIAFGWISGLIMFLLETKSRFVKFHAMQGLITFLGLYIVGNILGRLPLIGDLIVILTGLATLAFWIIMMIKTYKGEWFEIPYISDYAKKWSEIKDSQND